MKPNFRNELTKTLCNSLFESKVGYKYVESGDKVFDDEIIIWAGKKNGLKVVVCDSYVYTRDYFKVYKSGFKAGEPFETEVYNGSSVNGVITTVKRILESFNKRREFYLKNKTK